MSKKNDTVSKKNTEYIKAVCAKAIYQFAASNAEWLNSWISENQEFFVQPLTIDSFTEEEFDQFTDKHFGLDSAYRIRLPLNPKFQNKPLGYDLSIYTERLGVSGWDYGNQLSRFGGCDYDFKGDDHAVGLTEDELKEIWEAAVTSGYFTVVLSRNNEFANSDTPWKGGFHLYLKFRTPLLAAERRDHQNNVLAAFRTVGQEADFDFLEHADHKGDLLFVYHWKKKPGTLVPVHAAKKDVEVDQSLVETSPTRSDVGLDEFELSPPQLRFCDYCLANSGRYTEGRLEAQTFVVANFLRENGLTAEFETFATGKGGDEPNAYGFFQPDGRTFKLYRWGDTRGNPSMEKSWPKPEDGMMPCATIQLVHTFDSAFQHAGGSKSTNGFSLTHSQCKEALSLLGIELPDLPDDRTVHITQGQKEFIVEAQRMNKETVPGWSLKSINALTLQCLLARQEPHAESGTDLDQIARYVVTPQGDEVGWLMQHESELWGLVARSNLEARLLAMLELSGKDLRRTLGELMGRRYILLVDPFGEEYQPERRWNRNSPRYAFEPTRQERQLVHPHWGRINEHLGCGLDEAVRFDPWCQKNGIRNGAEYLFAWQASLFQNPKQSLPYLHFFSESKKGRRHQNAGKSTFHKSMSLLMTKGTVDVHRALSDMFNSELEGAILGFIEEKKLKANSYLEVKALLDADTITIRAMRTNSYRVPSYLHIVHTSNNKESIPIEFGDERVVLVEVETIAKEIPWDDAGGDEGLKSKLIREAPDYLAALLSYKLPPSAGRLYLPVLCTHSKREVMRKSVKSEDSELLSLPEAINDFMGGKKELQMSSNELVHRLGAGNWPSSTNPFSRELNKVGEKLREDHSIDLTLEKDRSSKRGGHLFRRIAENGR